MIDLRGKHVAVTGAAGFIGANVVRALLRAGAVVAGIVRPGSNLWRVEGIDGALSLYENDLKNMHSVKSLLAGIRPDAIIHLAAYGVSTSHKDRERAIATNVLGTLNLLEGSLGLPLARFLHTDTSTAYSKKNAPVTEEDFPDPVTYYSVTKTASTLFAIQFARENDLPLAILRPFSVYGYWEAPIRLIPTVVRAALHGGGLDLTAPGICRDFVFVEDVARAYVLALAADAAPGEIFNVGSGTMTTNEEVVRLVEEITGKKIRVNIGAHKTHATDSAHWVSDPRKAREKLGWCSSHSVRQGLEKTVAWFQEHPAALESGEGSLFRSRTTQL